MGPKRQRLFALYPDQSEPGPTKSRRKRKDKGKQREDPLQGLLQIDQLVEDPIATDQDNADQLITNPNATGPSNPIQVTSERERPTAATSHQNDLGRIDMGQMLQLKEMGYEVGGPVNGPNEGYPEYEVRQAVLQVLISNRQTQDPLIPSVAVMSPDPAPMVIDPSLLGQSDHSPHNTAVLPDAIVGPLEFTSLRRQPSPNVTVNQQNSSGMARPTTPKEAEADSVNTPTRSQMQLRKRAQADLSPTTVRERQARNAKKKKKVTDDDLAAMEAEKMVQAGSKRKRKATARK